MRLFITLILLSSLILIAGCQRKPVVVRRGFYFWKSSQPGNAEIKSWHQLHATKLYLKIFEVERNPVLGAIPAAKTLLYYTQPFLSDSLKAQYELVPTIFINNEVLTGLSHAGIDSLADNIHFLAVKYLDQINRDQMKVNEMQIDCDWTASTKENYFKLLRSIKTKWHKKLSCTLRLYPYKYRDRMGVPPVDRAMLMCYNLLNPYSNPKKNTILDIDELKAYLTRRSDYPLPLDVALPVYSRMQHYQNGRFANVIQEEPEQVLPVLAQKSALWYEVKADTVFGSVYLRRGDAIKFETVSENQLQQACEELKRKLPLSDSTTISFFHLYEYAIKHYPNEALEAAFNAFAD